MTEPRQKPGRSKQNYVTPDNFINAVKARLGITRFAHDFAADATNRKALTHFDEETDALSVPRWELSLELGGCPVSGQNWGWLNPPFSNIGPWAKRCRETRNAGGSIAFLVPAAVGSNWFRDHVDGHALVLLLNGRIHFMPDRPNWGYPKDCILALFSPLIAPGYEVWTWKNTAKRRTAA
jgi:phage N-6-adenine-methyltransferase